MQSDSHNQSRMDGCYIMLALSVSSILSDPFGAADSTTSSTSADNENVILVVSSGVLVNNAVNMWSLIYDLWCPTIFLMTGNASDLDLSIHIILMTLTKPRETDCKTLSLPY